MSFARETIVGNVGNVYEKRQVGKDNRSVVDFSVAMTPRKNINGEWVDGDTYWMNCTAWGRLADHIVQSFNPGDRVFLVGRIDMKAGYTNKEGVEVGPRPFLTVEAAGHEISIFPSEYKKNSGGGNRNQAPSRPKQQSRPKPAPPQKKVEENDDFDIDFDMDDFESVDNPF